MYFLNSNVVYFQSLLEVGAKLETLQKDQYASDTLVAQLRSLILDREHKRGRPFYDSEPVTRQSTTMLVHSLERCVQDLESESDSRQQRIREVNTLPWLSCSNKLCFSFDYLFAVCTADHIFHDRTGMPNFLSVIPSCKNYPQV